MNEDAITLLDGTEVKVGDDVLLEVIDARSHWYAAIVARRTRTQYTIRTKSGAFYRFRVVDGRRVAEPTFGPDTVVHGWRRGYRRARASWDRAALGRYATKLQTLQSKARTHDVAPDRGLLEALYDALRAVESDVGTKVRDKAIAKAEGRSR